jgi:hypothetical protein
MVKLGFYEIGSNQHAFERSQFPRGQAALGQLFRADVIHRIL